MRRRAFITLLGGAAAAWPLAARAEKSDRVRRVGVIMGFAQNDEVWQAYLATFRQGLQELGWSNGRNIRFDYRFTGESAERMHIVAEEMVALAPDVILVSTNSVVSATLKATRSIPVVFTWVSDPVGSGFVPCMDGARGARGI
jgi:putative ABC transport system substrate-binding protein